MYLKRPFAAQEPFKEQAPMPHERFFLPHLIPEDKTTYLKDQEFHHLVHVCRLRTGDEVELVNGQGMLARARIDRVEKEKASLSLLEAKQVPPPTQKIILGIALLRMNKIEWAIEKATELGATAFYLFTADHSEKGDLSVHQIERLRHLSVAALKQSGRLYLPEIILLNSLEKTFIPGALQLFGDVNPKAHPLFSALPKKPSDQTILFLSGPEKGFSNEEENCLKENDVQGIKLGNHILRAETAPIAAMSVFAQYLIEEFE